MSFIFLTVAGLYLVLFYLFARATLELDVDVLHPRISIKIMKSQSFATIGRHLNIVLHCPS